ncbi:hypothetical protein B0T24DRAFT_705834 [Lasiosphaeria ovina]|uniref:Heterokaryon incompatibility domain-containing protein n=1 Tax=Lasiosphaeria ovina TaxID=92902 RepID=A0AAE0K805_9PEZI|nr:hypothetical protein B0T24DRAFT_705834 [Lasiosphaeria ovina]
MGTPNPWDLNVVGFPSQSEVFAGAIEMVHYWPGKCASHSACEMPHNTPLPTRILDLGLDSSSTITLRESRGTTGRYICLNTFKIARALGVQYDDWQREAGRMADVYRNSYLTMAATWGNSPETGCFSKPSDGVRHGTVMMYATEHPTELRDERLLAPRVLHFGRQEMIWECSKMTACECGLNYVVGNGISKKSFFGFISEFKTTVDTTPQSVWAEVVADYSSLQLSYSRDKLSALSGLADEMRRHGGQEYLAGLWRDTLVLDMCWHRPKWYNTTPPRPPSEYRAPTWSWASLNGPVELDRTLYTGDRTRERAAKELARVLDAKRFPSGPSATGEVKDGFVTLRCSLIRASFEKNKICFDYQHVGGQPGERCRSFNWYDDHTCEMDENGEYYIIPLASCNLFLGRHTLHWLVVKRRTQGSTEKIRFNSSAETLDQVTIV